MATYTGHSILLHTLYFKHIQLLQLSVFSLKLLLLSQHYAFCLPIFVKINLAKSVHSQITHKLTFIFIIANCACPLANVQLACFSRVLFADHVISQLVRWCQWRTLIMQFGMLAYCGYLWMSQPVIQLFSSYCHLPPPPFGVLSLA